MSKKFNRCEVAQLPLLACCVAAFAVTCTAGATVSPYTETFASDNADWGTGGDWQTFVPLGWSSSGGPEGAGFVRSTQNFVDFTPGPFPLTVFRGQDNFGSSGNAFFGDWMDSGIIEFSFWVRHDAPVELEFFSRFTPVGANSPSMNFEFVDDQVQPNTWTKLSIWIDPANPGWVVGGGPNTYNTVFGNLGKIQLGADMGPLAGIDQGFNFDLSLVSIAVPSPGAIAVFLLAGACRRRRRAH